MDNVSKLLELAKEKFDKLEDLDKDFELMLYPNTRHGFRKPKEGHSTRESVQFWFHHFLGQELIIEENEQ